MDKFDSKNINSNSKDFLFLGEENTEKRNCFITITIHHQMEYGNELKIEKFLFLLLLVHFFSSLCSVPRLFDFTWLCFISFDNFFFFMRKKLNEKWVRIFYVDDSCWLLVTLSALVGFWKKIWEGFLAWLWCFDWD